MTLSLFFEDCKKTLRQTSEGFELTRGSESNKLKEVSYFQDSKDWGLDKRFGKFPKDESGFADFLEFDGWFLSKLFEENGFDECGFPFNWVVYGNFVLFEFGIGNGKSSVQVLERT